MRVPPGTRLGRYEVLSHLATGGMGEVYRALDTHLDRFVALKTVAERFEQDATSQPRFERERRVSTSLEHPHICRVLDAGREHGIEYFAMELLEGESLARRLERGAIPFEEAVGYAIEIADALCYAHGHGVIHRDLKPGNVFLTSTGAKVLDFGLAKVRSSVVQGTPPLHDTVPLDASQPGALIGSTPYLPPERLDGVQADTRGDIFAFGAVVYEMVTGRRAFGGESAAATIAALMSADPAPLDLHHPKAADLEWIIRGCTAKNPDRRWQAIADVRVLLKRLAGTGFGDPPRRPRKAAVVVAAAAGAALTALAAWALVPPKPLPQTAVALSIVPPVGAGFAPTSASTLTPQLALSPDNRAIAFVAGGDDGVAHLWLRYFDSLAPVRLPGTEGATFPFWSPDGASLGYFADGWMRRVDVRGGPSRRLAEAPNGRGASWSEDGNIIFAEGTQSGLQVVSADGGPVSPVTRVAAASGGYGHRWPHFLPGGRRFIFFSRAEEGIYISSLDGDKPRFVVPSRAGAVFVPPNRLLFVSDGTLLARAFDAATGVVSGDPVVIAETVAVSSNYYGAFAASRNGTIVFAPTSMTSDLVLMTRDGRERTVGGLGRYVDFRVSPDGRMLAVAEAGRDSTADIFLIDLTRGDVRTNRIASSPSTDASPVWSPDSTRIVFRSNRQNAHDLYLASATGTGPESTFQVSAFGKYPTSWSADGKIVFHTTRPGSSGFDIMIAEADGSGNARALIDSRFNEAQGQLSRDGKWLAYTADDTQSFQVYIRPLVGGSRVPVSVAGGFDPRWGASGDELFYIDLSTRRLTSVSVKRAGQAIEIGPPRPLFEIRSVMVSPPYTSSYDVAPDGEHFLVRVPREDVRTMPLAVLLNWPVDNRFLNQRSSVSK